MTRVELVTMMSMMRVWFTISGTRIVGSTVIGACVVVVVVVVVVFGSAKTKSGLWKTF
jgi:hypothetical protein